jgi:hypothetical protein
MAGRAVLKYRDALVLLREDTQRLFAARQVPRVSSCGEWVVHPDPDEAALLPSRPILISIYKLKCLKWRYREYEFAAHELTVRRGQILQFYQMVGTLRVLSRSFHAGLWRFGVPLAALQRLGLRAWFSRLHDLLTRRAANPIPPRGRGNAAPDTLARQTTRAAGQALLAASNRALTDLADLARTLR